MIDIDLIIKLGGSAITVKDHFETAKLEVIKDVANLIKQFTQAGLRCIVVHGAGSFGHHQAKKFCVREGWTGLDLSESQKKKIGFSLTRISVLKLNRLVTEALVCQNIPAIKHSPCGSWQSDGGAVIESNISHLVQQVLEGFIPVLHGDCVFDKSLGGTILSGDVIIKELCEKLNVKRVIFLSDVEGIYNKPPSEEDAKLLDKIYVNADGLITVPIMSTSNQYDVTGGMELKLKCSSEIVRASQGKTMVFICLAESQGSALHAGLFGLISDEEKATIISLAE